MIRNTIIVTGFLTLAIIVASFVLKRSSKVETQVRAEDVPPAATYTPPPQLPPAATVAPEAKPRVTVTPGPPFDPALRMQRDLQQIERSPAKDTPEAKQIEALLEAHGFERAALPAAYDYAYEFHRVGRGITAAGGGNFDEGARRHLEAVLRNHKNRLEKYGPITEAFQTNLLAIQPTVFFGHRIMGGEMQPIPEHWKKK